MRNFLHTLVFLAVAVFGVIVILTVSANSCVVDTNGTTKEPCHETTASIADLREAIAGGAITAGDMARLSYGSIYDKVDLECYSLSGAWIGFENEFCEPFTPSWAK